MNPADEVNEPAFLAAGVQMDCQIGDKTSNLAAMERWARYPVPSLFI